MLFEFDGTGELDGTPKYVSKIQELLVPPPAAGASSDDVALQGRFRKMIKFLHDEIQKHQAEETKTVAAAFLKHEEEIVQEVKQEEEAAVLEPLTLDSDMIKRSVRRITARLKRSHQPSDLFELHPVGDTSTHVVRKTFFENDFQKLQGVWTKRHRTKRKHQTTDYTLEETVSIFLYNFLTYCPRLLLPR